MSFYSWKEIKEQVVTPKVKRRVIAGEKIMLVLYEMELGAASSIHHHPHEQFGYVLQGKLRFFLVKEEKLLSAGDVYHVPPNMKHGGEVVGDKTVILLDVFHPIREDFLKK